MCTCTLDNPASVEIPPGKSTNGCFKIWQPLAGSTDTIGVYAEIRWVGGPAMHDSLVRISLYHHDNVFDRTIVTGTANDGSYSWRISAGESGMRYRIKIASYEDTSKCDFGPYFTIVWPYNDIFEFTCPPGGMRVKLIFA